MLNKTAMHKSYVCVLATWSKTSTEAINWLSTDSCATPEDPADGTGSVTVQGSTATYTCKSGFTISGPSTRTCQNNQWSGTPPTCIGKCEGPKYVKTTHSTGRKFFFCGMEVLIIFF